jgi:hypothetical protein
MQQKRGELEQKAMKYRRLAREITDRQTVERIWPWPTSWKRDPKRLTQKAAKEIALYSECRHARPCAGHPRS